MESWFLRVVFEAQEKDFALKSGHFPDLEDDHLILIFFCLFVLDFDFRVCLLFSCWFALGFFILSKFECQLG